MSEKPEHNYPMTLTIGKGQVLFRLSEPSDAAAVLAMIRELPHHDLLFLTRDLTKPEVVAEWLADEHATRILAFEGVRMVGYAAIHRSQIPWSQHVADLRILVAESARGRGLGRSLTQQAFAWALAEGVEKMTAQMTLDQKGAISVFEGLGFRPEALLRDHVRDKDGEKHDLLILSHEVAKFAAQQYAYGVTQAFGG
jgi:RimJ/RimL family protein N-acetyltransferase